MKSEPLIRRDKKATNRWHNGDLDVAYDKISGAISSAKGYITGAPSTAPGVAGARAAGGPVTGGSAYLIGERGPEIFRPASSGTVVPNHKLGAGGGSVTIHAPITISSSANVEDLKRTLERHLERWASEAFRTVQADTGLRWA